MAAKVLFVDDDLNILAAFQRNLRKQFEIVTAQSGTIGLQTIAQQGPFAVIISDMNMPEMNGVQFLSRVKEVAPDSVKIMLTGNADLRTAIQALHHGSIFQFLVKPCETDVLAHAIESAMRQYDLIVAERELLDKTLRGSVRVMIEILSAVQPVLFGRAQNMRQHMRALAKALGISETWTLELAAMLAPIGAVTIPIDILHKARCKATLSAVEEDIIARIPAISHNLLVNIPRLEPVAKMILYSRQDYIGKGGADEGADASLPRGARMLRILNDLADLTDVGSTRQQAIKTMRRREGAYDPFILNALAALEGESGGSSFAGVAMTRIKVRDLRVGMLLADDVETSDGTLLISKGHQVTETLIEKVRNFMELTGVREPIRVISIATNHKRAA